MSEDAQPAGEHAVNSSPQMPRKPNGQYLPDDGLNEPVGAGDGLGVGAGAGDGPEEDAWRADLPTETSVRAKPTSACAPTALSALVRLREENEEDYLDLVAKVVEWANKDPGVTRAMLNDAVKREAAKLRHEARAVSVPDEAASPADLLIQLAKARYEFCHSPGGLTYATEPGSGYAQRVRGEAFALALTDLYETNQARALPPGALDTGLHSLHALAKVRGKRRRVFVRVAAVKDRIYLDLGNARNEFIEVSPATQVNGVWQPSWRVVNSAPMLFTRASDFGEMPYPVAGGRIDDLKPFLALRDDHAFKMAVGFVLGSLTTRGPRIGAALGGVHGGGKTTRTRFLCALVDPLPLDAGDDDDLADTAPGEPDGPQEEPWDMLITAQDHWFLTRDNMSEINDRWADAMCRISTGGRMRRRTFYGLLDETSLAAKRPMIVTATRDLIVRPDLADRYLFIIGGDIPDAERRTEADLWAAFLQAQPRIIGCLLDAVSVGLGNTGVTPTLRPRMYDFLTWMARCEEGLGWAPGTFEDAYEINIKTGAETVADASPLVSAIRDFMDGSPPRDELPDPPGDVTDGWMGWSAAGWCGTATELLGVLNAQVPHAIRGQREWPKVSQRLGTALQEASVTLGRLGVQVGHAKRQNRVRRVLLLRSAPQVVVGAGGEAVTARGQDPAGATPLPAVRDAWFAEMFGEEPATRNTSTNAPTPTLTPPLVRRYFPGRAT
jgi:hypothetical protein